MMSESLIISLRARNDNTGPSKVARTTNKALADDCTVVEITIDQYKNSIRAIIGLNFLIKKIKETNSKCSLYIHTHDLRSDIIGYIMSKKFRIIWNSTLHTYIDDDFRYNYKITGGLVKRVWKSLLKEANKLIVMNTYIEKQFKNEGFSNTIVVFNSVGLANWSACNRPRTGNLGFIGNFITLKNVCVLPEALSCAERRIVVAGRGVLKGEILKELSLRNINYSDLGFIEDVDLFYKEIDILLLPSLTEACPLVLLDAAARGIPSIINDIPHLKSDFFDFGEFTSDWSGENVANIISKIDANYLEYSEKARNCVTQGFNTDVFTMAMKKLFKI